jgi:hypothetical protein
VIDVVTYAVVALAIACALWAFALAIGNKAPREHMVIVAGVVEAAVLIAVVVSIVMLVGPGPDQSIETGAFVGYLVVTPLVLPVGLFWALAEKSRWGTVVLGIAALVVPVLMVRLDQVWNGGIGG